MAFSFASPNRVLDNIKRLELQEAELPSLPSIQPNFDYDSGMDTSRSSVDPGEYAGQENVTDDNVATPHPTRRAFASNSPSATPPPASTSASLSASTSTSPYPPVRASPATSESPYIPNRAATSTPHTAYSRSRRFVSDDTRSTARHTQTYTMGHSRNRSDTDEFAGNSTGREKWHTPGEMSASFSQEGIEAGDGSPELQAGGLLGSEKSASLRDESYTSMAGPGETPITQRLFKSHVVLQRPGRRSHLAQSYINETDQLSASQRPSGSSSSSQGQEPAREDALLVPVTDRVPSLSRSEFSATDASEAASTPEGPSRRVLIASQNSPVQAEDRSVEQHPSELPENPTYDYQAEASASSSSSAPSYDNTPAPIRHASPYKQPSARGNTPFSQFSTPGMARDPAMGRSDYLDSMVYQAHTPVTALRDVTDQFQAPPTPLAVPFTPSPVGMVSKNSDFSTPRAPLDDAERRKNHVLAVLSSSGLPARDRRGVRGTPHPLRRMSASPRGDFILEEGLPGASPSIRLNRASPTHSRSHLDIDRSASAPPNESFVSVASSADLTTDRRGTAQPRFSRANISFPTILLPTHQADTSTPGGGGSLRGMDHHRADGVKIHKHLNAMNKQLLETNAELAREAEGWRDEVGRLMQLLEEAGVEVEEVDVTANVSRRGGEASLVSGASNVTGQDQQSGRDISVGMTSEQNAEIVQELAEKLESLEEILNEKDAQIVELEDEVAALKQGGGAGGIDEQVLELQDQLEEAERARQALHTDFASKTEQHAKRFGEICSGFEEQVAGLEAELGVARKEVDRLRGEKERLERLAEANSTGGREVELGRQVHSLSMELERAKADVQARSEEVEELEVAKRDAEDRAGGAEDALAEREEQLRSAYDCQHQAQSEADALKEELAQAQPDRGDTTEKADELDRLYADIDNLNALVEEREAELEALQGRLEVAEMAARPLRQSISASSPIKSSSSDTPADAEGVSAADQAGFVAAIEDRLDEAYREIGRLKHELSSTPHRKTTIEAKDAKIRALEQEKAALLSRASPVRSAQAASGTPTPAGKPTPFVHRAIADLRMPKTPGPLKDLSWLNTTIGDANEGMYRAQLGNLHEELEHANQQLDDNFSRLEAAGLVGIELAEKLAAAQQRISDLEDEIRALVHRNKASLALVHAQRKENTQESEERLQAALSAVHTQLDELRAETSRERKRLQADNQRMRDAKTAGEDQLENEINNMRADVNEAIDAANSEVEQAKRDAITASTEAGALARELQSTRADLEQTGRRLAELQTSVEDQQRRHAREMGARVSPQDMAEKVAEIERLRGVQRENKDRTDRLASDLAKKTSDLQRAEERIEDLQAERQTVLADLEDFERDLNAQRAAARRLTEELQSLQDEQAATQGDKRKYAALQREHEVLVRQHEGMQGRQREAEEAKQELARVVREYKAVKAEMKVLEREIRLVREERGELDQWKSTHVCETGSSQAMAEQKAHFKAQTRDLATQIQYLKAKYTRESTFRNGLALQKRYLLLLVGGMSLNEQATLKAIASFGFPMPEPPQRKITLKAVGLAVVGLIRAKKSAEAWRAEKALKAEAVANFGERRRVSGRS